MTAAKSRPIPDHYRPITPAIEVATHVRHGNPQEMTR